MGTQNRLELLLLRLSRYFKTDLSYAASGGFWLIVAQLLSSLFSFPLSIAYAHFLTQNEYGIYRYAISIAAAISVFSFTGIFTAVTRAAARGHDGALPEGLRLSLLSNLPVVAIALVGSGYYIWHHNFVLGVAMLVIAATAPFFNTGTSLPFSFLNGKRAFKPLGIYSIAQNLISAILIFLSLVLFQNALITIGTYFVSFSVSGWFLYRRVRDRYQENTVPDPELKHFSIHSSILNGIGTLADRSDSIALFTFIGAPELALYSFAEVIPEALNRFGKIINSLALPKYAEGRPSHDIFRKTMLIMLAFLPIGSIYVLAAPYIFSWFFPAYMASVPYSQALILTFIINGTLSVAYLDAYGAFKQKYVLNIGVNIARIGLVILGVWSFGIWGAVLARIASKVAGVALALYLVPSVSSTRMTAQENPMPDTSLEFDERE